MGKLAVLLSVLLGLGCQSSGEGSREGSDGGGAPVVGGWGGPATGAGGNGSGAGSTGSGAGTGGMTTGSPPTTTTDAAPPMAVDTGECPFSMAGKACAPNGANCAWSSDCTSRRCDCVNGNWACSETQRSCGGMCPAAQSVRCGDACTGNVSGCLCRCGGGGPNYAGCSCTGGRWQCSCGR